MPVPKYLGSDCELSTSGVTADGHSLDPYEVTSLVLQHIDAAFEPVGTATWSERSRSLAGRGEFASRYGSRDWGRRWAPNGQCFYCDLGHLEVCTAETGDARAFAAQRLVTLRIVEQARRRAEAAQPPGTRLFLSTANGDALDPGVSWGSHLNVSVSTELWEALLLDRRRPAVLGFVTSALAALVPFFGAGCLLPLRDGSTLYSLSGRAHHISRIETLATTEAWQRGLLNARREPHAVDVERLHLICFDHTLAGSALLGAMLQLVLAAAEEGVCGHGLLDPLRALRSWSFGLDVASGRLAETAVLADGGRITLGAYVARLAEALLEMCRTGLLPDEVAPGAAQLLPRVVELADALQAGAVERLAPQLDWASKLLVLLDRAETAGLQLDDPVLRLADHDYGSTNHESGAFWQLWGAGLVDPLVSPADVEAALVDGPADGRGWARGRLVQRFGSQLTDVDWSRLELRRDDDRWSPRLLVELPSPARPDRRAFEPLLEQADDLAALERALVQLGAAPQAAESDPLMDISAELVRPDSDRSGERRRATPSHHL